MLWERSSHLLLLVFAAPNHILNSKGTWGLPSSKYYSRPGMCDRDGPDAGMPTSIGL